MSRYQLSSGRTFNEQAYLDAQYLTHCKIAEFVQEIAARDYMITEDEIKARDYLLKNGIKNSFQLVMLMTLNGRYKRSLAVAFQDWPCQEGAAA